MNRYEEADENFKQELIKRNIDPRDVNKRTLHLGKNTPHTYFPDEVHKLAIPTIVGGIGGGLIGGEIAKKVYPGDRYMKNVGRTVGATLGVLPVIPYSRKLRHKRLERNIMRRNKLLEKYDQGLVTKDNPTGGVRSQSRMQSSGGIQFNGRYQSDFSKDEKNEKTRLVLEGDKESLTKLISTLKSDYPELKLQAKFDADKIKSGISSFAKSKIGKVVITSGLLGALVLIAKPKIVARLRVKNTQFIDVSEYRYTDDAETVVNTVNLFNEFLNSDPVKSAKKYPYNDIEKAYLDALTAIDRSSPNTESDKDYLTVIWDTIYAFYNATEQFSVLDNRVRFRPNIKSIYNV